MQEDKEPVFDAADTLALGLAAIAGMARDMRPDAERMRAAAEEGHATATDLADWLVRALDLPFREAHHITGRLVKLADDKGRRLAELGLEELQSVEPRIGEDVFSVLGVEASVRSRTSFGGTSPENVRRAVADARARFL